MTKIIPRVFPPTPRNGTVLESLVGQKVWIIQYDDIDDAVLAHCVGVDEQFIALRRESEGEPSLFINLTNVREVEVFRGDSGGEIRYLRAVKPEEIAD
jgi:hypothetical protein